MDRRWTDGSIFPRQRRKMDRRVLYKTWKLRASFKPVESGDSVMVCNACVALRNATTQAPLLSLCLSAVHTVLKDSLGALAPRLRHRLLTVYGHPSTNPVTSGEHCPRPHTPAVPPGPARPPGQSPVYMPRPAGIPISALARVQERHQEELPQLARRREAAHAPHAWPSRGCRTLRTRASDKQHARTRAYR